MGLAVTRLPSAHSGPIGILIRFPYLADNIRSAAFAGNAQERVQARDFVPRNCELKVHRQVPRKVPVSRAPSGGRLVSEALRIRLDGTRFNTGITLELPSHPKRGLGTV
jgi:hypothetical protein